MKRVANIQNFQENMQRSGYFSTFAAQLPAIKPARVLELVDKHV
jgi:hypothetical protein